MYKRQVLESTDPDVLVENVFPAGEFYGSEIVITGFLNCLDDICLLYTSVPLDEKHKDMV